MIRKTMRIGAVRTSIKLEEEFWAYLKEAAEERGERLSMLINEVVESAPDRSNLASTLRTFALAHARLRLASLRRELDRVDFAGGSGEDLAQVLESCPLPYLLLDRERVIRRLNRAFAVWLNLDPRATVGKRLDHILLLRGISLKETWPELLNGRLPRAR